MNCSRCNSPLPPDARFCRVCGLPISTDVPDNTTANPAPFNQEAPINSAPTMPSLSPWDIPQQPLQAPPQQPWASPPQWASQTQAAPHLPQPQSYQPTVAVPPGSMGVTGTQFASPPPSARRPGGCLARVLITFALVIVVLIGAWFVGIRPYLHSVAQNQINQVLSSAVNQIFPAPPFINSVPVTETVLNNLIVLNTAPADPVQHMHVTITPTQMQVDFQVYGFSCTVTGIPVASGGNLIVTNVTIQGLASLIMSPDELTSTLNTHLADARVHLGRSITGVTLKDHELDLSLG